MRGPAIQQVACKDLGDGLVPEISSLVQCCMDIVVNKAILCITDRHV